MFERDVIIHYFGIPSKQTKKNIQCSRLTKDVIGKHDKNNVLPCSIFRGEEEVDCEWPTESLRDKEPAMTGDNTK